MQTTVEAKSYHCRHILTTGHRCRAKSLRHQDFCFYHTTTRPKPTQPAPANPAQTTFDLPFPEDRAAIQISIGEVLRRIARNELDPRRAGLLLYGLQIASLNLPPHARPATSEEVEPDETIEEIEAHPQHGPIAPVAEYLPEPAHLGPMERLRREFEQGELESTEENGSRQHEEAPLIDLSAQESTPATLPNLQAAEEDCAARRKRTGALPAHAPALRKQARVRSWTFARLSVRKTIRCWSRPHIRFNPAATTRLQRMYRQALEPGA